MQASRRDKTRQKIDCLSIPCLFICLASALFSTSLKLLLFFDDGIYFEGREAGSFNDTRRVKFVMKKCQENAPEGCNWYASTNNEKHFIVLTSPLK